MKKVFLIGDSIRMGYQEQVRQGLEGLAVLGWPEVNGRDSWTVLKNVADWIMPQRPDIIHINCGLHDIIRAFDKPGIRTTLEQYCENLDKIFTTIRSISDARLIWATTTPVNSAWHHQNKNFDRLDDDVRTYNQASMEVARKSGIPINDLYAVVMLASRDNQLSSDGVHFTDGGYKTLGKAVTRFIQPWLAESL